MTKQAMGDLVTEFERRGYVARVPDPSDRRAKLVMRTDRGWDVETIARAAGRAVTAEAESEAEAAIGSSRMSQFRQTLEQIATIESPGTTS